MLALGIVAMLCAVAMVGIGFATFNGTARTFNEGNSATAGNILINNGSFDPMIRDVSVEFDTYTYSTGVAYYFESGGASEHGFTAKAVGSEKELTVNNNTGANITTMTVGAKATANISNADFTYFFRVTVMNLATAVPADAGQISGGVNLYYSDDGGETLTVATSEQITAGENLYYVAPVVGYIDLPVSPTPPSTEVTVNLTTTIADGASVVLKLQLCIGYVADLMLPTTLLGDPNTGAGYTIPATSSAAAPISLDDVNFGFSVADGSA